MSDIIAQAIENNKPTPVGHDAAPISSITTKQALINNTMKTALYDIEKNNINNPAEELKGKASAVRNIGAAAIAGSVAADVGAPLVHNVHVVPTATPYLTANVEHKFNIPAVVPQPAVVTSSTTNVVHPTISVAQDKKASESKSEAKA